MLGFTMHARACTADLPPELQRRVLADLDPPARLALFCTSRALARTVLLHAPSDKKLTKLDSSAWPPPLARLLGDPLLQPLTDLELRVENSTNPQPPPPPTPSISQHVARLHLSGLTLTPESLVAWRLHDAVLWPHLQHLTLHKCRLRPSDSPAQPLQPIPRLQSFSWHYPVGVPGVDHPLAQVREGHEEFKAACPPVGCCLARQVTFSSMASLLLAGAPPPPPPLGPVFSLLPAFPSSAPHGCCC